MNKITKILLIITASITNAYCGFALNNANNYGELEIKYTANQYDSLLSNWYERNINISYDTFFSEFIDIDLESVVDSENIPDSVYEARLKSVASAVQLPYNQVVRKYIIRYTRQQSAHMERLVGLSRYYFPIFEEELDRQGLPQELRMLPIIESALQPKAISRAGAAGLWQFILTTGKYKGLEITSFVDERMDPVASTRAACLYLKELYDMYDDWTLAIAAYNCGPGNVNKALVRAPNAKTYWDIYDYLPTETRGYIPAFIAATYAYTYHKAHGIEAVAPPRPLSTDTVTVQKMTHFDQISSTLGISNDVLRELNPQFKRDVVPSSGKKYSIVLPQQSVAAFVEKEAEIYSKDSIYLKQYLNTSNLNSLRADISSSSGLTYKVKKNDVLGGIASRYGVSLNALMRANNIKNARTLRIGQVLVIPRK